MRRLIFSLAAIALVAQLIAPTASVALSGYASAPRDVSAAAISGGIRITWSTPADLDTGVLGYRIEYSTSGNSGTWEYQTTVGSSTYTYDFIGLNQVAIYIRVAATTNAGIGSYGYPWTKIYGTTSTNRNSSGYIDYEAGYGIGAGQASSTYSGAAFSRIKYRMDANSTGAYYAETDFYKWNRSSTSVATARTYWDPTIDSIMIPTTVNYGYLIQANVTDLNIFSTSPAVSKTTGSSGVNGRLEIWPWNYGTELSTLSDGASAGNGTTYDYNDTPDINNGGAYGSFQIHDMANYKPVFVWNNQGNGATAEIAFGKNSGTHPDWTFCSQGQGSCPVPSAGSFRLQIFVNIPVTPLADVTGPTISRIDSRVLGKNGDTLTVRSTEIGTLYLVNQSVSVTSIASINAASSANKNSVSISTANTNTVMTISALNSGTYNLYGVDVFNNLSAGIIGTIRIDNTPPTATSIAVSASGTSILLTASETITNSTQVYGTYTISDSGSALSVTSTSFSGLVATLNLSRAIPAGATVYFAYAPSSGVAGGRWVDQAGNEMAAITTRTITNNSISSITVNLNVPTSISKGTLTTISVSVSVAGKVTFFIAGKRIAGCLNKVAAGATPITVSCNFKPALTARQTIKATLIPTNGSYPTTVASVERFILKRSTLR